MRQKILFLFFVSTFSFSQVSIDDVVSEINVDTVSYYVNHLQSFGTRFLLSEKRFEAAHWIKKRFEQMGFESVELDSFECKTRIGQPYFNRLIDTTTLQVNIIATLPGKVNPDQIAIICGHYDSFSRNTNPFIEAPGADDNASGTTAVLESARAIMKTGYSPDFTIRFIAFAAEELMNFGDAGSRTYADNCKANGDNIIMVVNNDMIGYCESNYIAGKCNIGHPDNFENFDSVINVANQYSAISFNGEGYHGADLQSFLRNGYTGVYMEEAEFNNNNYHMNSDIASNVEFRFMTEVIKASTAVLISSNQIITDVRTKSKPEHFSILNNYPNPFNPITNITYTLSDDSDIELTVVDHLGRVVEELYKGNRKAGHYSTHFNASMPNGIMASGVYYLVLKNENEVTSTKMLLLK